MSTSLARIQQAALNPEQLVRKAVRNPRLFSEISAGLKADRPRVKLKVGIGRYQTPECRNVAIGHAILALGVLRPLLRNPARAVQFFRKQTRNRRPATRRKAEQFLKSHG